MESHLIELAEPDAVVKTVGLMSLSGLLPEEQDLFREGWEAIVVERRREIVSKLVGLAEENVEMDFLPVFFHCLRDSDAAVRERAVSGLWESDDRSTITPLIELLSDDTDVSVRAAAAIVLGRAASLAGDGKLLPRDTQRISEALMATLHNSEEELDVRRRALESVAVFDLPEVREWVHWGYGSDDLKLRQSSVFAMGRTASREWLSVIAQELKSPEPAMRYEAANGCAEMGEEAMVPHLAPLLNDHDHQVQIAAIQALGAIGSDDAQKLLRLRTRSSDDLIRAAAEEALEAIEMEDDTVSFKSRI
jgi:HEAT repeat protein